MRLDPRWLWPTACLGCEQPSPTRLCDRCTRPFPHRIPVAPPLRGALAMAAYRGPLGRALAYAKGVPDRAVAVELATAFAKHMQPALHGCRPDAIVAVPPAWNRLWVRGFDTAALLAHALSLRLEVPVLRPLARRRGVAQKTLGARQRRVNARRLFRARRPAPARVLLVDDVITTGSTIQVCAEELMGTGTTLHVWGCALCAERRSQG